MSLVLFWLALSLLHLRYPLTRLHFFFLFFFFVLSYNTQPCCGGYPTNFYRFFFLLILDLVPHAVAITENVRARALLAAVVIIVMELAVILEMTAVNHVVIIGMMRDAGMVVTVNAAAIVVLNVVVNVVLNVVLNAIVSVPLLLVAVVALLAQTMEIVVHVPLVLARIGEFFFFCLLHVVLYLE